ncbi:hypothetical protein TEA_007831 [Camellia sinensis var. sinensis]|uniref:BHLH domain-containing protein n=1 Tax=Camellia sinensis var. sinensis TaxID=542762 RepID=A0A4S4EBI7_CAMSN|nr:hypothetical protein TEA_007831 [Camellia sinensis var. sinensis]
MAVNTVQRFEFLIDSDHRKSKQQRRMLAWEDAYYDNHEQRNPPKNMCFPEIGGNLRDWHSHDPLGLAVAKMSYHVYSLGEGYEIYLKTDTLSVIQLEFQMLCGTIVSFDCILWVIGQVAVTGKHMWISADKHLADSCSPFEHCDGWQTQFSAGIRTVVVVAIVPHGVIQLGSLKKSDISTRSSGSGIFHDSISNLGRPVNKDKTIICTPTIPSIEKPADHSYLIPLPGDLPKMTTEVINKDGGLELSASGGDESAILQSRPEDFLLGQQKQVWKRLHIERRCEGETSGLGYLGDLLASAACNNQNGMLCIPEPFGMQILRDLENMEFQEINKMEPLNMPFKFSADCELYEVLGPAFQKQNSYCDWEAEKTQTETEIAIEMPEAMDSSSLLTADSGSEHLLEAVVANVCRGGTDVKSEKSFCESVKSLLTTENMPQPTCDKLTVGSAVGSFDQSFVEKEAMHCLSSEACGVSSSKGFSSRSHSTFSGQLDSAQEPAKTNKKRARPGENCRPRPRDRQLIQDRIKELRELVPNGSKCSIDSLLERTIKHMLFMQSITKHAEKLKNCNVSKLRDKEMCVRGLPIFDQGSTWAVEVGSHMKVCPIMIENINMNGQMLIEMLCEDSTHFLEIAEAIRSLGLTILKGVTEACDKKTLMCFVVEGQNRSMHRVDILWPLVQILQSKTTI